MRVPVFAAALALLAADPAFPQNFPARFPGAHGHIQLTPPRVERAPVVDGVVDDAEWSQAAVLDSFTHNRPIEGVPDSLGTVAYVLYDDQNLYVGFRVTDDPRAVQAPIVPRDQIGQGDWVGVSLDTYHDRQRSFFLCANPLGIQMDGIDQDGRDSDMAPDFLYTSKGRVTERGYEVEMAIPFKTLRFPNHNPLSFGFQAIRDIRRNGAHLYWAPVKRDINSYHAQLGALEGIAGVKPGRNLEVNPTLTGSKLGVREPGGIRYDDLDSRFGLGVKLGVTSNLIADVAVTPDFSQVEADAGAVELNERFAIFFPEKRPFFLEGADVFRGPTDLVYTRRIVDPRYGVKLTGKTGRTGVGLLHAMDRSASGSIETLPDGANPYFGSNARFDVARFRQDVFKNSYVGVLLGDQAHEDSYNRLTAVDARFNLRDRYSLTLQGMTSWSREQDLRGAIASLTPAEQAAVDPDVAALDGERRDGKGYYAELARETRPLGLGVSAWGFSPDFEARTGFIRRVDHRTFSGYVRPHLYSKGKTWFNAIHFPFSYERVYEWHANRMSDELWDQVVDVNLPMNTWFGLEAVRRYTRLGEVAFEDIDRYAVWAGCERFRTVRAGATLVKGDQVVFAETRRGRDFFWEVWTDLRFSSQFDASVWLRSRTVWRDLNDSRFGAMTIPRLRLSYQFNRELAVRWITEMQDARSYDENDMRTSHTRTLTPDVLVSYYLRPGTVVYLGYGSMLEGQDLDGLRPQRNSFFTKLSYLWQV